jgi:hypothetical protein
MQSNFYGLSRQTSTVHSSFQPPIHHASTTHLHSTCAPCKAIHPFTCHINVCTRTAGRRPTFCPSLRANTSSMQRTHSLGSTVISYALNTAVWCTVAIKVYSPRYPGAHRYPGEDQCSVFSVSTVVRWTSSICIIFINWLQVTPPASIKQLEAIISLHSFQVLEGELSADTYADAYDLHLSSAHRLRIWRRVLSPVRMQCW